MSNPLFDRCLPSEWAERGQVIEETAKLSVFPRLRDAVAADLRASAGKAAGGWRDTPVAIRLRFGWADGRENLPLLRGRAALRLPAVCQRCLDPFELPVEQEIRLFFNGSAADGGLAGYEGWESDEGAVRPLDIVDELLVMAMPLSAMHNSAECRPMTAQEAGDGVRVRPFAELRERMGRGD